MFIVGELLTYVWSREGMHDALWLAYIATFIKQWGLTSATGFMWALVPEVIAYGELKSGKRNAAIINAIMGLFFKIGFTSAALSRCGCWRCMDLMKAAPCRAPAPSTGSL